MTLWIDVEDIFHFATLGARPSGIQRVSFELCSALRDVPGLHVRFVRDDSTSGLFREIGWDALLGVYRQMAHEPLRLPPSDTSGVQAAGDGQGAGGRRRRLREFLPPDLREPLGAAVYGQKTACLAIGRLVRNVVASALRRPSREKHLSPEKSVEVESTAPASTGLGIDAEAGDTLCVFGAPWHVEYASKLQRAEELGLRFAVLLHDIIPIVRPEFVMPKIRAEFEPWYRTCLPHADYVFSVSRSTARDVEAWASRTELHLRAPVVPISLGPGLRGDALRFPQAVAEELPMGLSSGQFVLVVSTLEVRKNHILAFRAWRRLLELYPDRNVPSLVFAGHVGWTCRDLMEEIENSGHLGGKLIILEDLNDDQLSVLYRNCRFTIFPSHYEGWGLPIAESLEYGKVCAASRSSSMTEIGPEFCLFFDPGCVEELVRLVLFALERPEVISAIEDKIRRNYVPANWYDTARTISERLEMPNSPVTDFPVGSIWQS